jgi:hypothetical protein
MKIIKDIHRVSEVLFLVLGFFYIFVFLAWKNNFYSFGTEIFLRLADVPLLTFGVILSATSLRLAFTPIPLNPTSEERKQLETFRSIDYLLFFAVAIIIGVIVYVDIFIPNKYPFLKW